jgi:hypothetical protein
MMVPRIRAGLGPADFESLLAGIERFPVGERLALRRALHGEGPDGVLAHPAFDPEVAWSTAPLTGVRFPLFVYAVVRRALVRRQVGEAEVADYVATVIVEFGHGKRAWSIDGMGEHPAEYLVDVVLAGDRGVPGSGQHLGNLALWLAGLFPDHIAVQQNRRGAPGLEYYDTMGGTGYRRAADEETRSDEELATLMRRLAGGFPVVRRALNEVSDTHFFPGPGPDPVERLLRQVSEGT